MSDANAAKCPICGGRIVPGNTTMTVDYSEGLLIARNVPAKTCEQCGEAWITDESAKRLESLLQGAKAAHRQLEILDMAA